MSAPSRLVAFWGTLLLVLFVLSIVGHESLFDFALWAFAVSVIYVAALAVLLSSRRSPAERGEVAWPASATPALGVAVTAVLIALAFVYGIWFAVMAPVPACAAVALVLRGRRSRPDPGSLRGPA